MVWIFIVITKVLTLMPHPERDLTPTNRPDWTAADVGGTPAGLQIFRNAVAHGLEPPDRRAACGKDPTGHVRLEAWSVPPAAPSVAPRK